MEEQAPSLLLSPEEFWTSMFSTVCERISSYFARSETKEGVKAYLKGLLSPVERKNGWQLAEEAGLATPYSMQYLLNRATWDSNAVRDELQAYIREMMASLDGIYVLDETGFREIWDQVGGSTETVQWNSRTSGKLPNRSQVAPMQRRLAIP